MNAARYRLRFRHTEREVHGTSAGEGPDAPREPLPTVAGLDAVARGSHYQRVKLHVAEARRRLELEADAQGRPPGLHRRFEVVAGAQAQVDWGDEGTLLAEAGASRRSTRST